MLGKRATEQGSCRTGLLGSGTPLRLGFRVLEAGPGYLIHIGSGARPVIVVLVHCGNRIRG